MNDATRALNPQLELLGRTPNEILAATEHSTRSNFANDGRSFQKEIELTAGAYQSRRIAHFRKVDPPTRVVGGKDDRRVIFLSNPWLDFAGCWTSQYGRAIFIEAKSTQTHRLPFKRSGGLTEEQVSTIKTWRLAGAATCVLWQWRGRVCLFTPEMIVEAEGRSDKSLVFESGLNVPRGEGTMVWDFLPTLAAALWPVNKP